MKKKIEYFMKKKVNTTMLAYGQTGSGKTHTLFGKRSDGNGKADKDKGLC